MFNQKGTTRETSGPDYKETIRFLYGLTKRGIKLGLHNIRTLLDLLKNPQMNYRAVHVAGTNGKGYTCMVLDALLRGIGLRTGLFTSPHMVRFTERIKVDGEEIETDEVVQIVRELRLMMEEYSIPATFFEVVTGLAFEHFRRKSVEWAVVETGMGGRFDATNVIQPEVSVITRIGLDHQEFLGRTIREIAFEKAGIVKEAVPVVSAPQVPEAIRVLEEVVKQKGARMYLYGRDFYVNIKDTGIGGVTFDFYSESISSPLRDIKIPVTTSHNAINTSLALQAILVCLGDRYLSEPLVRQTLMGLSVPGRTELKEYLLPSGQRRWLLFDGAHNPEASEALARTISEVYRMRFRKVVLLFGVMADKDLKGILSPLIDVSDEIVLSRPSYERSAEPEDLAKYIPAHRRYTVIRDAVRAFQEALRIADEEDLIVVTGSFYMVGEVKGGLGERQQMADLREAL